MKKKQTQDRISMVVYPYFVTISNILHYKQKTNTFTASYDNIGTLLSLNCVIVSFDWMFVRYHRERDRETKRTGIG